MRIDPTELNGLLTEKPLEKLGLPEYTNVHTMVIIYYILYIQEPAAKYGSVKILKDTVGAKKLGRSLAVHCS